MPKVWLVWNEAPEVYQVADSFLEAGDWIGLLPGTPVATANIDAHAAVPATGTVTPGTLVMIMGTSICHMTLSRELGVIDGICGERGSGRVILVVCGGLPEKNFLLNQIYADITGRDIFVAATTQVSAQMAGGNDVMKRLKQIKISI